jgi:hypothetical protein
MFTLLAIYIVAGSIFLIGAFLGVAVSLGAGLRPARAAGAARAAANPPCRASAVGAACDAAAPLSRRAA